MPSLDQSTNAILQVLSTIYSCQSCGGLCQILKDMETDGQVVLTRLKDGKGVEKECPYCGKLSTFRSITRNFVSEEITRI